MQTSIYETAGVRTGPRRNPSPALRFYEKHRLQKRMTRPVYLDYNATTPVDAAVMKKMLPFFTQHYGNPSSKGHAAGWYADEAVSLAREQVAAAINSAPEEIVFTSGATEAVNLAIKGVAAAYGNKGRHLVTVATEHRAVLATHERLQREGFQVTVLPVSTDGSLDLNTLENSLTGGTILVSIMWANNEIGTLHPMAEISRIVRDRGILLFSDATQAIGKVPVDAACVDLLAFSAHKFYGPKGAGGLFVRRRNPRVRLAPLIDGSGHEGGLRSGTLNVPGIVGAGEAIRMATDGLQEKVARMEVLRDLFENLLTERVPTITVNAAAAPRLPNTSSVTFHGVRAAELTLALRDLAVSTGSACSTGSKRPSPVLKAISLSDEAAFCTVRFSLGRPTTEEEVRFAAKLVAEKAAALLSTRRSALQPV